MSGPTTRKTLLARIQAGDEIGWEEFYESYTGFVLAVAQRVMLQNNYRASDQDLADLLQNVMLELAKPGKFRYAPAKGRFRSWFASIIKHKLQDLIRSKMKHPPSAAQFSTDDADGYEFEIPTDSFSAIWSEEWANRLAVEALAQLKLEVGPKSFQIFEMVAIHELSPKEIAAKTGNSPEQVHLCKHRCLKRLRAIRDRLEDNL